MASRAVTHRAGIAALATALVCGAALAAPRPQDDALPRWKVDPFTRNDPDRMSKLGYVSYGPFPFGTRGRDPVTTDQIDATLAPEQILWVETAHFRIGTALNEWAVPLERDTRAKLAAEIERLQQRLPTFNAKARTLTPWLRLHLTALRAEEAYREFIEIVGVSDSDFPRTAADVIVGHGRFMGYGPYLGMADKFLVLVTSEQSSFRRYTETYLGRNGDLPQRWHFTETGALLYALATEMEEGDLRHDTALHGDLVFGITHGFLDGFRHYSYDLPVWITEGLAHWFQRRVSPRWNTFTQSEGRLDDHSSVWRWEPETRRMIVAGDFTPFAEAYTWRDYGQISFTDHIAIWSRWDYLMSLGNEKFAEFLFLVKGRVDPKTWLSDSKDLVGATREGLQKAYGLTPLTLDERWKEWVMQTYR